MHECNTETITTLLDVFIFQTRWILNADEPSDYSTSLSTISIVSLFNFSHLDNGLVLLVKGKV